jgi:hypothetical protein
MFIFRKNAMQKGRDHKRADGFSAYDSGGTEMECPYLKEWLIACCTSGSPCFVLTPFAKIQFCKGGNHTKCPFYMKSTVLSITAGKQEKDRVMCGWNK